jgi:HEAT repeat protein
MELDLDTITTRFKSGTHTDEDIQILISALQSGQSLAWGDKSIAVGGSANDAVLVPGDNNRILIRKGATQKEIRQLLLEVLPQFFDAPASAPELSPEELRSATLTFLQDMASKFKETRLFHTKQPIVLKDQYVPIQVTLEPHWRDVETLRGYSETEDELKRQQMDWQEAKQKHSRLMVLAGPGMGKSTLLRMEGGTTAEQEWHRLECDSTAMAATVLPLLLRLSELAKDAGELIETIPRLIQRNYPRTAPVILPLLTEKLKAGQCLLLLDALDEVPKGERIELKNKLDRFVGAYPCSVICTSRIVGYDSNFLAGGQDAEIVPFREPQIEQYVMTWFTNAAGYLNDPSVSAPVLLRELHSKPQVRGLVQNPLLLALICSLYQEQGLTLPSRRVQVYEKAVEYMLEHWSQTQRSRFQGKTKAKTRLLEALAYHFSCEDQEIFDWDDLYDWMENYLDTDAPRDLREVKTEELIAELSEADGILQKLNSESKQYLFLHRTFQEYLTACYLSRAKDGVVLAKGHVWEYDWHETISLMPGLMKKPQPLLQAIVTEQDDIFQTQLLLAGRCLAECLITSQSFVVDIIDRIYQVWEAHPDWKFVDPVIVTIAQTHSYLLDKFLFIMAQHQQTDDDDSRFEPNSILRRALDILGRVGNSAVIPNIQTFLNCTDGLGWRDAVSTLEAIGSPAARRVLMSLYNGDKYVGKRRESAWEQATIEDVIWGLTNCHTPALGRMQGAPILGKSRDLRAWDILVPILQDTTEELRVRGRAARGLGRSGDVRACAVLIAALAEEEELACEAAWALGQLGCPDGNRALLLTLQDSRESMVRSAITALANTEDAQAVDALIAILMDQNHPCRETALDALIEISDPSSTAKVVDLLVAELAQINKGFGVNHILSKLSEIITSQSFNEINHPGIQRTLSIFCKDENREDVRHNAIQALMQLNSQQGYMELLSSLYRAESSDWVSEILGTQNDPEVISALIVILQDQTIDSTIRKRAGRALRQLANSAVISAPLLTISQFSQLLINLLNDSDDKIVSYAAHSLARLKQPESIAILVAELDDGDDKIVSGAAHCLANLNRPEGIDILIAELNDSEHPVTGRIATTALTQMNHPKATAALLTAINHTDNEIADRAVTALEKMGNSDIRRQLIETLFTSISHSGNAAYCAITALERGENSGTLQQLFNSPNIDIFTTALERVGTPETLQRLIYHPDIDIFTPAIFRLVRTLAIRFSKADLPFVPVYPERVMGKRAGSLD